LHHGQLPFPLILMFKNLIYSIEVVPYQGILHVYSYVLKYT